MGIVAKAGPSYKPAPAGVHGAVCCDVVDLGMLKMSFGGKAKEQHKVKIVWQIPELRDDGKRFTLQRQYTLSLHEKSTLRRDLESWRGKKFTEQELQGFDLEVLLEKPCMLNVIHEDKNGSTYANVSAIMRLARNMEPLKVLGYVREIDRKAEDQTGGAGEPPDYGDIPIDDDVPFRWRPQRRGRQVTSNEEMLQVPYRKAA